MWHINRLANKYFISRINHLLFCGANQAKEEEEKKNLTISMLPNNHLQLYSVSRSPALVVGVERKQENCNQCVFLFLIDFVYLSKAIAKIKNILASIACNRCSDRFFFLCAIV
jgi:hypothetical protein